MLEFYGTRVHHRGQWMIHGYLRNLLRANADSRLLVVREGLKWELNPSDFVHQDLFWYGAKDYWDVYHIRRMLLPGDVIFDIGANFGYYSIRLASHLDRKCTVYSFEPFPSTFQLLKHHIEINGMDTCANAYQLAFSDTAGSMTMSVRVTGNSGSASLSSHGIDDVAVEVVTLDNFCESSSISRADFIKIDVEGFEASVLRGGSRVIDTMSPIIFLEVDPPLLRKANTSVDELVTILNGHGFSLYRADREKLIPFAGLADHESYQNIFCVKPAHVGRMRGDGLRIE